MWAFLRRLFAREPRPFSGTSLPSRNRLPDRRPLGLLRRGLGDVVEEGPAQPWLGWLLVCLCRQRERQRFLLQVHDTNLKGCDRQEGDVPGLEGWRFYYHGIGLCLSGPNGEVLDMDFHDASGGVVDPWFFAHRVFSFESPPFPEARARRWLLDRSVLVAAIDELRSAGILIGKHTFALCPELESMAARVADARFEDETVSRTWREALGDREGDADLSSHAAWLESICMIDRKHGGSRARAVVAALGPGRGERLAEALLRGDVDSSSGGAIEGLEAIPGSSAEPVVRFMDRLDPRHHHPFSALAACRFLLGRGVQRDRAIEVASAFAAVERVEDYGGNPMLSDLAFLILEHAPARALPFVRRSLRSNTPIVVQQMAATLCVIDQLWCHRELESSLRDQQDVTLRRYLAAALGRSSRNDVARRRGTNAEPPPPERAAGAIGYTWDEVAAANLDDWFTDAMERARPLADRIRSNVPEDWR